MLTAEHISKLLLVLKEKCEIKEKDRIRLCELESRLTAVVPEGTSFVNNIRALKN